MTGTFSYLHSKILTLKGRKVRNLYRRVEKPKPLDIYRIIIIYFYYILYFLTFLAYLTVIGWFMRDDFFTRIYIIKKQTHYANLGKKVRSHAVSRVLSVFRVRISYLKGKQNLNMHKRKDEIL